MDLWRFTPFPTDALAITLPACEIVYGRSSLEPLFSGAYSSVVSSSSVEPPQVLRSTPPDCVSASCAVSYSSLNWGQPKCFASIFERHQVVVMTWW